jgi:hypothetical protein
MRKFVLFFLMMFVVRSQAVIVAGGDGTQNTTTPDGGQGWDYVGRITSANGAPSSVTYIDNNWFITAYHIQALDNPTGVLLGDSSYTIDSGSWTRLSNTAGGDADLAMFRVTTDVSGLSAVSIAASAANGSDLTLIGNGRNRAADLTSWNVSGTTWTENGSPSNTSGYQWASGATKRWGNNTKEDDAGLINDGYGTTDMYYTDFDDVAGEAQGATYDSGGGVFVDNGGDWELSGLMLTTAGYSDQPSETAVFGNVTYVADLSQYAEQITETAAIPEPSVLILGSVFSIAGFCIRRIFMI